jgi:protein O-mannosyl-transferase
VSRYRRASAIRWRSWRAPLVAAAASALIYAPSLLNGFALDDVRDVEQNSAIRDGLGPIELALTPYRTSVPPQRSPYRPLTSISFGVDWALGGGSPIAFHATNVLLHALTTAALTSLLLVLGSGPALGLAGGLVFAVHPVHVEAVANVVGRADVLMTLFVLVGALIFLDRSQSSARRVLGVGLAYGLALASKENGVVFPALLVGLLLLRPGTGDDAEDRGRTDRRDDLWVLAGTLVVLVIYLAVRYRVLGTLVHRDTAPYITILPTTLRWTTAVANLGHLARLLVMPVDLISDYGPDVVIPNGPLNPRFLIGLLLGAATITAGYLSWTRDRWIALGLAWTVLSLLVVSNLIVPIGVWVAERTLYLPSVGLSMLVVGVGSAARHTRTGRTRIALFALLVALGVGTWRTLDRIPAWRDTDAILMTLAEEHPESFRSQWYLARKLTDAGRPDRGIEWFERAVETNPNDLLLHLDHARALLLGRRPDEAESVIVPLPPADPARFVYLAQSMIMRGRPEEARVIVREGLLRFPLDVRLQRQARELGLGPGDNR